jgi:hypothetical protein
MHVMVLSGFYVFNHDSELAWVLQTGPIKNGRITQGEEISAQSIFGFSLEIGLVTTSE